MVPRFGYAYRYLVPKRFLLPSFEAFLPPLFVFLLRPRPLMFPWTPFPHAPLLITDTKIQRGKGSSP
jgi:hypothetical protein